MNVYAEAVKKGGDYWNNYMPDKLCSAHALSRLSPAWRDNFRMYLAEKHKDGNHAFQIIPDLWSAL